MKAPTKSQLSADLAKALKEVAHLSVALHQERQHVDNAVAQRNQATDDRDQAREALINVAAERDQAQEYLAQARSDLAQARESLKTTQADLVAARVNRSMAQDSLDAALSERAEHLANVEALTAERDHLQEGMDARARLALARMLAAAGQTDLLVKSLRD